MQYSASENNTSYESCLKEGAFPDRPTREKGISYVEKETKKEHNKSTMAIYSGLTACFFNYCN